MTNQPNAMDSRIDVSMFMKGMFNRFQNILARQLSPEEKLHLIIESMEKETQQLRVEAREAGAAMRAMADPETAALEPLEASKARREKLVKLGGQNLANQTMLGQIQQEVRGLDTLINSQQSTFDTLAEAYETAKRNYQIALQALETTREQGPAIIMAIKAHERSLQISDKVHSRKQMDTTFLNDLTAQLEATKAQVRTDKALDEDLDASKEGSIDAALAQMDAAEIDEGLMAEFQAAAGNTEQGKDAGAAATFRVTVEPEE